MPRANWRAPWDSVQARAKLRKRDENPGRLGIVGAQATATLFGRSMRLAPAALFACAANSAPSGSALAPARELDRTGAATESAPPAASASPAAPSPVTPQAVSSSSPATPAQAPAVPDLARDDSPRASAAVERELESFEKAYETFPALRRLPDFLSVDAVLALMPDEAETHYLREGIHAQLEGAGVGPLFGAYLDEEQERLFALWLGGNLTQMLVVFDGRRLAGKRVISRGKAWIGDVVSEADGARPEILIENITSMSVCCHPVNLTVLRVGKRGALTEALSFPRGHADVGPGVRWSFLNRFEFADDRTVVTRVVPEGGPRYEFAFEPRSGRFQPTRATAQALREERSSKKKVEAAEGDALHLGY
jgi:hypothetical protein